MKIVTGSNARWLPRMRPYLASLSRHSQADNVLLGVGCPVWPEFLEDFPGVRGVELPAMALAGTPAETESVQHGSWLPHVAGPEDELIVFTDGDIVMQRPFAARELEWLNAIAEGAVGAGWNSGPEETLAVEAGRLFPRVGVAELANRFGGAVYTAPCYNIGVLALRRITYQALHARYMEMWDVACDSFGGPARQQWLVCWAAQDLGLDVHLMPYSLHTHGCYPLPAGAALNGRLLVEGEPVVFRHHV